ncbi:MAG: DUF1326 domain-containing protein [Herbaspirillum sp.]|nr:DUF1326 domain-containing protein [Herbaspirillum sp.]
MSDQVSAVPATTPDWHIAGEWLDVCSCNSPCPCTYAQPPTGNHCEVLWAYRINSGHYGGTPMAGLRIVLLANFTGNLWNGAQLDAGIFLDARADEIQRDALVKIFTGQVGGWMAEFVPAKVRDLRAVEFADITVDIESTLERWRVTVDDRVEASGMPLYGPTSDTTRLMQSFNPPGSEVGPTDAPVTWGKSVAGRWKAFGFDQNIPAGQASKHIPFDWHGPDKS